MQVARARSWLPWGTWEPSAPAFEYRMLGRKGRTANLIVNTTTTGLTIRCELDPADYPTKVKLTDQEKGAIPISRHDFHGEWNYTIKPAAD